ncbi:stage II sporulation protein P [Vallitalea guaymasensis]|uniref:Stage II sporulation protein P n=1 Tax=Vallitalea guaymasensis TaxID=1185412 RepID=A0A8J8SDL4_9FIRM|nr:stage II sporulation protein P [Vallitalea guaymasensis]QUH30998.1 stage II sporulation protein P [Vallitalea guaymasensis]
MNKAYLLKKNRKASLVYMAVLIVLSIIIIVKLFGLYFTNEIISFKNLVFSDIDSSFFTNIIHSVNPSVEYYLESNNKTRLDISNYNKIEALYGYNIPLISFIMNDNDYSYCTASENYPKINQTDKSFENDLEHYEHDESFFSSHTLEQQIPVANITNYTMEQLNNFSFLKSNLYTFDPSINPTQDKFPIDKFLSKDMSIDMSGDGPKVLIYHTHSQESFVDSVKGKKDDTVVGVGDELARILEEKYNIKVLHHRKEYDIINGKIDRDEAYQRIEAPLKDLIKKNPSIEVMIDIHRDGVRGNVRLVNDINGKQTAKIMFFNGLALYPVMPNKYVVDNMAFSLQMQLKANELYPNFTRKIYLRGYRYNLHLKPKSLLVEVGAQTNTVSEAMNAMEPLAKILYEVIK